MPFALIPSKQFGRCILELQKNRKGFTLIEVLVTLIILAISLLALAGLMATTTKSNANGGHITEATTFAQDRLEQLRATRWEDIAVGNSSDQVTGSTGITYLRNSTVEPNGNLRTVTIRMSWVDRSNHEIRLRSVISQ